MESVRPDWIRTRVSWDGPFRGTKGLVDELNLTSVCVEAVCPNRSECWHKKHVTFMILGARCTRSCGFCNVGAMSSGRAPLKVPYAVGRGRLDLDESCRIARAVKKLGMKYVVITSPTRDDLEDKGAGQFIKTVRTIKSENKSVFVEVLIPDFDGRTDLVARVAFSGAVVVGHNIELVRPLYASIRPGADYKRSIEVLNALKRTKSEGSGILVKSSIIIGLGETSEEIIGTLEDLDDAGVDIVYIGQYLSPSPAHRPVKKYYAPEEFNYFAAAAMAMGFSAVSAAPLARSSFNARRSYLEAIRKGGHT